MLALGVGRNDPRSCNNILNLLLQYYPDTSIRIGGTGYNVLHYLVVRCVHVREYYGNNAYPMESSVTLLLQQMAPEDIHCTLADGTTPLDCLTNRQFLHRTRPYNPQAFNRLRDLIRAAGGRFAVELQQL